MRLSSLVLSIALLTGGCAAQIPLDQPEPTAALATGTLLTAVPAPKENVAESGRRLSMVNACFEPCEPECAEAEEKFKHHELALFVGYTFERGDGGVTLGLDYTYWFTERFGVGPFLDYVAGDIEALAVGAGVWFRPIRRLENLALYVAPGLDIVHEEEHGEKSWEVKALLRLGAVYAFPVGRGFRILPSFYVDLIAPDTQAYVMGLSIAKEF